MSQFAVIGLGQFALTVAEILAERGAEVIAIDNDEKKLESIKDLVTSAVCLDSTDEEALRSANIQNVDAVVLGIGETREISILTAAILRKIGITRIYAKADSDLHARILKMIGVQHVILPEQHVGREIANLLLSQHIFSYMEISKGHTLVEVSVPLQFIGKSLKELDLRKTYKLNVVAIKRTKPEVDELGNNIISEETNVLPDPEDVFEPKDTIVVVGKKQDIDKLIKMSERQPDISE
jgi:trk system potassium uptake protein TrkA